MRHRNSPLKSAALSPDRDALLGRVEGAIADARASTRPTATTSSPSCPTAVADPDTEVHNVLLHHVFPARAHIIDTTELPTLLRAD